MSLINRRIEERYGAANLANPFLDTHIERAVALEGLRVGGAPMPDLPLGASAGDTEGFLNRLYGGDQTHHKALVVIEKGKPKPKAKHYWHVDVAGMAKQAAELDQSAGDVYHSCAVFTEAGGLYKGRTQENAVGACAFWQDIDVGKGENKHSDIAEARRAVVAACSKLGIAHPAIVSSGNGLHLYWFAGRLIPKDDWKRIARKLRIALQAAGLKIDTSRSEELASVLRPPGTRNKKGLVQEVT
jgi:hypothetical protein